MADTASVGRKVRGKVVVITGGARGIGLATATALHNLGAKVAIGDVDEVRVKESGADLGLDVYGKLDVTDPQSFSDFLDSVERQLGPIDVLINNAGIMPVGRIVDEPDAVTRRILDINVYGVILGSKLAAQRMVPRGSGHVINMASLAGELNIVGLATYCASKHAVVAITEGLYHSLRDAQMPVGVSCLCPGWVRTGILDADRNWPAEYGAVPEVDAAAEIARNYVRRAIDEGTQPAAIADHVLDAVREGRYWVLPHPEFVDIAMERFAQIGEGANPERPEHTPGMPPRSQVLAEVMAAMAATEHTPPTVPHDSPPTVPPA